MKIEILKLVSRLCDEEFSKLGYEKIKENSYGASYTKYIEEYNYTHEIYIREKANGTHVVFSSSRDEHIGLMCVGVALSEMQLVLCYWKMYCLKHIYEWEGTI